MHVVVIFSTTFYGGVYRRREHLGVTGLHLYLATLKQVGGTYTRSKLITLHTDFCCQFPPHVNKQEEDIAVREWDFEGRTYCRVRQLSPTQTHLANLSDILEPVCSHPLYTGNSLPLNWSQVFLLFRYKQIRLQNHSVF